MTALRAGIALCAIALAGCAGLIGLRDATPDGEPATLVFTSASQGVVQQPLDAITVEARDVLGKRVAKFAGEVVLTLGNNPGGATLLGTLTTTATEGTARFELVGIDRPGTGYTLVASTEGLPAATSNAFDVVLPRFTPVATGIPGGSISGVAVSPAPVGGTATVFAGAADGVYKSTDHGASWKPASFGGAIEARLVADPSRPGVVYLGRNAGFSSLKKTMDGGATWHDLPPQNSYYSFTLDPKDPSVVYAAGPQIRRSSDGGTSWTDVDFESGCAQIAVDPVATGTLYCAALPLNGQDRSVYKSSNAGATWGPANSGLPLSSSIPILLATPKGVFVSVNGILYRSLDAGASWTSVVSTYSNAMAYAPSMPNRIYLSRIDGISVSNDGGVSFAAPVDAGDSVHDLAVDPTDPDVVYGAGSGAGVVVSTNGGGTWSAPSKGLDAHLITSVAIAPGAPSTVLTTTNAAMLRSINGGTSWTTFPKLGVTASFDPTVSTRAYLCGSSYFGTSNDSGANFTGGTVIDLGGACQGLSTSGIKVFAASSGRVVKSTNSGASWIGTGLDSNSNAYAHGIAIGDAIGDVVVATTADGVYRSSNGGTSFTQVLPGYYGSNVVADPKMPARVIVGTCPGFLVSSDGGASFRAVTAGACVQQLSSAGSALYAVGTKDEQTFLFTSTDGGSSWTSIQASGIPGGVSITSVAASDDGATAYIGTSGGLYKGSGR